MTTMKTIRQTAAMGILPEFRMREMLKQGRLPGVYSGNRFLVNVEALSNQLYGESVANVRTEAAGS